MINLGGCSETIAIYTQPIIRETDAMWSGTHQPLALSKSGGTTALLAKKPGESFAQLDSVMVDPT